MNFPKELNIYELYMNLLIYACKLLSSYGNEAEMPVRIFLLFAFRDLSRASC